MEEENQAVVKIEMDVADEPAQQCTKGKSSVTLMTLIVLVEVLHRSRGTSLLLVLGLAAYLYHVTLKYCTCSVLSGKVDMKN
jgi:hypothetical protein